MNCASALDREALIAYLAHCGGEDHFEFTDDQGEPDLAAARSHAECLRSLLGSALNELAEVEQRVNRVTIRLLTESAMC